MLFNFNHKCDQSLLVLIICNAFDDETLRLRGITSDSPAASRKVVNLSSILCSGNIENYIVSMGRGKTTSRKVYSSGFSKSISGINFIYAPFVNIPFITHIVSMIGILICITKFLNRGNVSILLYNRVPTYLVAVFIAKIFGCKIFLDLEDGTHEQRLKSSVFRKYVSLLMINCFNYLCSDGALVACEALKRKLTIKNTLCFYGAISKKRFLTKFTDQHINILMSGTLSNETGIKVLLETVSELQEIQDEWTHNLVFHLTGRLFDGDIPARLLDLKNKPNIIYHGRLSLVDYSNLLIRCDVGLSLKPVGGVQDVTTFPSKVLEYCENGLLVITTNISDVNALLDQNAVFLNENRSIVPELHNIVMNREGAAHKALAAQKLLANKLSDIKVSQDISKFFSSK